MEFAGGKETYRHFLALAENLNSPKYLNCPADDKVSYVTVFTNAAPNQSSFADTGNRSLSYFAGLDATRAYPSSFLSGDRNLTNTTEQFAGVLKLGSGSVVSWTETNPRSGHKINSSIQSSIQGNVLLSDGGVLLWTTKQLRTGLANTGIATNRLAMPIE